MENKYIYEKGMIANVLNIPYWLYLYLKVHFGHLRNKTVLVKAQNEEVETEWYFNRGPAPVLDFFFLTPKGWNLVFLFLFPLCFHWTLDISLKPL